MFGMGWSELILIGVIALIVVGPKDLPGMFRAIGQFTGKARGMAREFSRAMEAAADESGIKDVSNTLRAASNPASFGADKLREAAKSAVKEGSETEKLAKERAEAKAKFDAKAKELAEKRQAAAAAMEAAELSDEPEPEAEPAVEPGPMGEIEPEPAPKPAADDGAKT